MKNKNGGEESGLEVRKKLNRLRHDLTEARRAARILLEAHVYDLHSKSAYEAEWPWIKRRARS